jgi:hypothetical protein
MIRLFATLMRDDWPAWLARFQNWWPQWRYLPHVLVGALVVASSQQLACEAEHRLRNEQQRAAVEAAIRAGKQVIYEGDNPIGRVVNK